MTPAELTAARLALGLNAADLGRALDLGDDNPGRLVRLWEAGTHRIPGPVGVALRYMLAEKAAQVRQELARQEQAAIEAQPTITLAPTAQDAARTRRRGP